MLRIRDRLASERGGVIVLVAIVLPLIFLLVGTGIAGFSLYGSHRELQRAADQSALAGAAAMPPFDPNRLVDPAFPIPDTEPHIEDMEELTGTALPRMGDLVPDPRSVACAYGADGLSSSSALVASALGDPDLFEAPTDDDGNTRETNCDDGRIFPRLETNPDNTTPVECTNRLVREVATLAGPLDPDDPDPLLAPIQESVNAVVNMPLNHVLPAAFTPRMHVDVLTYVDVPLLGLFTGSDGTHLGAGATAYRRIKNAIVVPILPAQKLEIDLGLVEPWEVMTDPVNLNTALHTQQSTLIDAVDDVDERLDTLMSTLGLPCEHLLHNLRQDLRDLYDPPTGPAPSALDVADAAVRAGENAAARTGLAEPDVDNPDSLAGDAVLLVGIAVDESMEPVSSLQIPILDTALVVMDQAADGSYEAAVVSALNARGVFRASLVG